MNRCFSLLEFICRTAIAVTIVELYELYWFRSFNMCSYFWCTAAFGLRGHEIGNCFKNIAQYYSWRQSIPVNLLVSLGIWCLTKKRYGQKYCSLILVQFYMLQFLEITLNLTA